MSDRLTATRELVLLAACAALVVIFATSSPYFLLARNLATIARNSVELLIAALGMTLVLATGGIDIAAGSVMGIGAILVGKALAHGWPGPLAAILGPLAGAALGGVAALVIVAGRVPPIIATLGLYGVWRAALYLLLGGAWLSGLPATLDPLVRTHVVGIPLLVVELVLLYAAGWLALRRTALGTWWLALGGNEAASRLAGVRVDGAKALVYVLSGALAGLAATFYVAQYRNVEMTSGDTLALEAIVAAVLGGASVTGGRASIVGTALGVILVRVLQNGFVLLGLPSLWEQVLIGGLLLVVLVFEGPTRVLGGRVAA